MKSWVEYDRTNQFPIQNIPFGVFTGADGKGHCATRIAEYVVDLNVLALATQCFSAEVAHAFAQETLNEFMGLGRPHWKAARAALQQLFSADEPKLRDDKALQARAMTTADKVSMRMPAEVGDYTDFYSSREHATNVGKMFRPTQPPLLPNWLYLPVGYHGRSSSIVVSGTPVRRPLGQTKADDAKNPSFGACKLLDMEVEVGTWVGKGNAHGEPISANDTINHVFGFSVFNDWSARDIQKWEYVPLGPFLAKSFASTISPWIVTIDAVEPFLVAGPPQGTNGDPEVFSYLKHDFQGALDLSLTAKIKPPTGTSYDTLCSTNLKHMYWSVFQQLAHHTINGCPMHPGDLLGSGTISGPTQDSYGSMLELTWRGSKPIKLTDGTERKFFQDGDSVLLEGVFQGPDYCLGFGPCEGTVLPAEKI